MIELKRWAYGFLAVFLCLSILVGLERCAGARARDLDVLRRDRMLALADVARERARADSLERVAVAAVARADSLNAPLRRARARSDSALAALDVQTAAARRLAADSAAHEEQLRAGLEALADRVDSSTQLVRIWRDSADARLARELDARSKLTEAISAKNAAVAAAVNLEAKNAELVASLERLRPGPVHRGLTGLMAGASGTACAGAGYLVAGPVGAAVGLGACSIVAGVLSP